MKKSVELPIIEPLYSTYHYQGSGSATIAKNETLRNWYLNESVSLTCNREFLIDTTTPRLKIVNSSWLDNPYFEQRWYDTEYLKGYINFVIKRLIDNDFYVVFGGVDDYYVKGKSFYKKRHRNHDGLICGYDSENKTYTIYAYDENWVYRKFVTPQKCFNDGLKAMFKHKYYEAFCGIRPKNDIVELSPDIILNKIKDYLNSSFENYPVSGEGNVFGIVVHDYILMYLDKLSDGSIPHERMDWRIFRTISEHKKAMYERIKKTECILSMKSDISNRYSNIVSVAENMQIMYSFYHKRKRESLLSGIKDELLRVKNNEVILLNEFIKETESALNK